ncbi:hypothetical protein CU669_17065 [Paramagnetospirillum kuznetsovii]|uniref:Hemerythrin-like domain-containing protein n=1 Tax=Paramagnetospirillum kuznetsovii TaxID=2053833 RepID=A0A364NU96_9PROT|nr:hemerythrin domain-containing protein [Paramagnetospirillum kuznetsovii]RAU20653.1 hypothetical protein CU669_17065 [Paramagnetospirillum kuznetsovii]
MPTWDHDDCDPVIEAEHNRLYRMMNRLEPVILKGEEHSSVARAINMLQLRMSEHFQVEEELFITSDWNSRQIMIDDHRRLLNMLGELARLSPDDSKGRRTLFMTFLDELVRHDTDIDAPLFSLKH